VSSAQFPKFIAAAVQASPAFLDLDAGLAKAEELIAEAALKGAELIVFPETWLPTYPYWPPTLEGPMPRISSTAMRRSGQTRWKFPAPRRNSSERRRGRRAPSS